MKAHLTVYNESDYLAWMKEAQDIAIATNDPEAPDFYWGWKWNQKKKTKVLLGDN